MLSFVMLQVICHLMLTWRLQCSCLGSCSASARQSACVWAGPSMASHQVHVHRLVDSFLTYPNGHRCCGMSAMEDVPPTC